MTALIYVILFVIMLSSLYTSGKCMGKGKRNLFNASLFGIIIFTLNEGLRFGRGLDYNYYARSYAHFVITHDSSWEFLFTEIARALGYIGVSWQGYVILMSFVLIVAGVLFSRNFKDVAKWALPLFAVFTLPAENLMRWFFGWSVILIGLSFILETKNKRNVLIFVLLSALSCLIHFYVFPVAIIYLILSFIGKPILKPFWSILLFLIIGFTFNTELMKDFAIFLNAVAITDRADSYVSNAEYWLTGGFAGIEKSAFPNYYEFLLFVVDVWVGYRLTKNLDRKYICIYNLFLIGFITYPICKQIELLYRFNNLFTVFQFVILAYTIQCTLKKNIQIFRSKLIMTISFLIILNYCRVLLFSPFNDSPHHYLYVWDKNGREYLDPYIYWIKDMK